MGRHVPRARGAQRLPEKHPMVILPFVIRFYTVATIKDIFFFKNCKTRKSGRWCTARAPVCEGIPGAVPPFWGRFFGAKGVRNTSEPRQSLTSH